MIKYTIILLFLSFSLIGQERLITQEISTDKEEKEITKEQVGEDFFEGIISGDIEKFKSHVHHALLGEIDYVFDSIQYIRNEFKEEFYLDKHLLRGTLIKMKKDSQIIAKIVVVVNEEKQINHIVFLDEKLNIRRTHHFPIQLDSILKQEYAKRRLGYDDLKFFKTDNEFLKAHERAFLNGVVEEYKLSELYNDLLVKEFKNAKSVGDIGEIKVISSCNSCQRLKLYYQILYLIDHDNFGEAKKIYNQLDMPIKNRNTALRIKTSEIEVKLRSQNLYQDLYEKCKKFIEQQ